MDHVTLLVMLPTHPELCRNQVFGVCDLKVMLIKLPEAFPRTSRDINGFYLNVGKRTY